MKSWGNPCYDVNINVISEKNVKNVGKIIELIHINE